MSKIKKILMLIFIILILILSTLFFINKTSIKKNTGIINKANKIEINKNITNKEKLSFILKYDGLWQDIYNECNAFILKKDKVKFWNNEFKDKRWKYNIDFWKKINCKINNNIICWFFDKVKNKNKKNLDDIVLLIYWLYTWNITINEYNRILLEKNNLDFPDFSTDYIYSKYYWLLSINKIRDKEDCINFILSNYKWNTH